MLFFLKRFRMTLLIGLAIPLSLVLTFVIMYFYRLAKLGDISINIMSLMGLMLSVGMLVDNSIVVIEAIVRRRQTLGEDAKTATLRGASEVAMPIICSTLTNICVFVPMVFLQERSGGMFTGFMKNMGLTIVIVMVASLLVSLTVVPMAAAILLRDSKTAPPPHLRSRQRALRPIARVHAPPPAGVRGAGGLPVVGLDPALHGHRALVRDHLLRAADRGAGRDPAQLLDRREARSVRAALRAVRQPSPGARDRRRELPLPPLERAPAVPVRRQQPHRDLPAAGRAVGALDARDPRPDRGDAAGDRRRRAQDRPQHARASGLGFRGAGRADRRGPRDPRFPQRAGDRRAAVAALRQGGRLLARERRRGDPRPGQSRAGAAGGTVESDRRPGHLQRALDPPGHLLQERGPRDRPGGAVPRGGPRDARSAQEDEHPDAGRGAPDRELRQLRERSGAADHRARGSPLQARAPGRHRRQRAGRSR